jgi:hypothetical protein
MVSRFQESKMTGNSTHPRSHHEVSRILTAAVISPHFCQMLLTNPGKAIAAGYGGEAFQLPREEKNRLTSIHATSLADFAAQLRSLEATHPVAMGWAGD